MDGQHGERSSPVGKDAMTSAQSIPLDRRLIRVGGSLLICGLLLAILVSCTQKTSLSQPNRLQAPYSGPALWAIAPLVNESGTSAVNTIRISEPSPRNFSRSGASTPSR